MKKFTGAGIALLLGTTAAYAGGIDRSGQSISALFEEGTYAEISFGSVSPDVSGTLGPLQSGSIAPDYTSFGFAYKADLNEKFSIAIIMDQPFGTNVNYANTSATYPLNGTSAEFTTKSITLLGDFKLNENVSVYAGPRYVSGEGFVVNVLGATSTYSEDSDIGYVVGASYEIPEIALRASLTYSSSTDYALSGTSSNLTATMPQSVNLDFQTGIAVDTLLFGTVRWVDWSEATLDDSSVGNLADFNDTDVTTYTVGLGRRFSENFAGQISVSHEESTGLNQSNLGPTDGYTSVSIGGAYSLENGLEISGGIRKVWLGDAVTELLSASFTDNSVTAIGLKLAYNY